jgi:hypothetical protein
MTTDDKPTDDMTTRADLIGKSWPVLDSGFVRLVDVFGSDAAILEAARHGGESRGPKQDRETIRYLVRKVELSPLEQASIKLHIGTLPRSDRRDGGDPGPWVAETGGGQPAGERRGVPGQGGRSLLDLGTLHVHHYPVGIQEHAGRRRGEGAGPEGVAARHIYRNLLDK